MLILSREFNQTINIGDNVTATVSEISESQIKLSIRAPEQLPIARLEIFNRESAKTSTSSLQGKQDLRITNLIISRSAGQSIMLGNDVEVKVTKVRDENGRVKIGIAAPQSIKILRAELAV